jgi:hypothetical protein
LKVPLLSLSPEGPNALSQALESAPTWPRISVNGIEVPTTTRETLEETKGGNQTLMLSPMEFPKGRRAPDPLISS